MNKKRVKVTYNLERREYILHFSLAVHRSAVELCGTDAWIIDFIINTYWITADVWIISSSFATYEEVGGSDRPPSFGTLWYDWGKKILTLPHLVNTLINYMTPDRLNIGYSLSWHCLIHCMVSEKKVQLVNPFHVLRYDEQFMGIRSIIKALVVLCILHCFIALKHLSDSGQDYYGGWDWNYNWSWWALH
jgi:hypothetical protein